MALDINSCQWINLDPATVPGIRAEHATWWDENRDSWVIYGGAGSGAVEDLTINSDMWEYAAGDVEDWQLIASPATSGPRYNMGYAFGGPPEARVAMIVGGVTPDSYQNWLDDLPFGGTTYPEPGSTETWTYDGSVWTQLFPANPPYVQTQGQGTYPTWAGLVWSDDFDMWIYTVLSPVGDVVGHRRSPITYGYYADDWHILHDGYSASDAYHTIGIDYPLPRSNHACLSFGGTVWHAANIPFNNTIASGVKLEVYKFRGDSWARPVVSIDGVVTADAPNHRQGYCWCYDGQNGLLFSGETTSTGQIGNGSDTETWAFSGTNWTRFFPSGDDGPPEKRYETNFVWDEARNRALVFGGTSLGPSYGPILNDTWELITPIEPPPLGIGIALDGLQFKPRGSA